METLEKTTNAVNPFESLLAKAEADKPKYDYDREAYLQKMQKGNNLFGMLNTVAEGIGAAHSATVNPRKVDNSPLQEIMLNRARHQKALDEWKKGYDDLLKEAMKYNAERQERRDSRADLYYHKEAMADKANANKALSAKDKNANIKELLDLKHKYRMGEIDEAGKFRSSRSGIEKKPFANIPTSYSDMPFNEGQHTTLLTDYYKIFPNGHSDEARRYKRDYVNQGKRDINVEKKILNDAYTSGTPFKNVVDTKYQLWNGQQPNTQTIQTDPTSIQGVTKKIKPETIKGVTKKIKPTSIPGVTKIK